VPRTIVRKMSIGGESDNQEREYIIPARSNTSKFSRGTVSKGSMPGRRCARLVAQPFLGDIMRGLDCLCRAPAVSGFSAYKR
jgi:hypothetical protein